MKAFEKDGQARKYASEELQRDYEVVLKAVKQIEEEEMNNGFFS